MWSGNRLLRGAAVLAAAAALAACSGIPASRLAPAENRSGRVAVGVYEPYSPGSFGQVSQFASAVGEWPSILVYYSKWGQPFASSFAADAAAHDSEVLVQVDPDGISLGSVADGGQDAYLRQFAAAVKRSGRQVIISFAQEMNGNWYMWGTGHAQPASYIAAWRHVVTVFRRAGASRVTWLWDVNCAFPHSSPVGEWWPGSAYVDEAGVDCYYAHPADTFASLFGPTLDAIRKVTSKPVLIAETATGPDSGPQREAQIRGLFAGVKADHLLGFVWFDQAQHDGPYHQDWRLEDAPAALAAFRAAVKKYR